MSKKRSTSNSNDSNSNDKLNTIVGENKDLAPDNSSEVLVKADVNPEVLETPNLGSSDNSDEVLVTADANPEVLETPNPDSSLNTTAENPPIVISLQPPNTKLAIKKKYKYLHIIDGEKGGVGKSFFARALCHYFTSKKIPILIVDADTTNPDVSKVYGGEQIAFSENERKSFDADRIFELALENNVLVNLPAQISNIVDSWYSRNNILDIADNPDVKIKICKWFVSSGAFDSTSLFKDSLEKHGTKIKHILVKNLAFCDANEWEGVVTELKKEIKNYKNYGVLEVTFPKLAYKERDIVLKDELKFEAALSVDSVKQKIGILGQQRVKTFLDSAIASIEAAENTLIFHK